MVAHPPRKARKKLKIPTARKLPSGTWFIQLRIDGQSTPVSGESEDEVIAMAMAIKAGIIKAKKAPKKLKLTQAIDEYIESRTNALSPSTIRGYRAIQKGRFKTLMNRDVSTLTQDQCQRAVNTEAKLCSAKTLLNAWRFIQSVIREATGENITVRLPQVKPNEHPYLSPKQIPVFVDAVKGTSIEIPALLALSSLRRSELLNLKWENIDFENGVIQVSGAAVYGEEGLVRRELNKNSSSTRIVPIIPPLKSALKTAKRKGEYVVNLSPSALFQHINAVCERNGLPKVGVHGLRHSFASLAYHLDLPEKVTMEIGGWSNDQTMRKIYTHIAQSDITERAKELTKFFE